jgi:hypothetical protein
MAIGIPWRVLVWIGYKDIIPNSLSEVGVSLNGLMRFVKDLIYT